MTLTPINQPTDKVKSAIVSRAFAVLLTALLFGAVGVDIERQDMNAFEALTTYDELRAYYSASLIGSYWAWFGIATIFGLGYLSLIEGLAYGMRQLVYHVRKMPRSKGQNGGRQ